MRKLTTILLLAAFALSSNAQTAREEIKANRYLSASNYVDYDNYPATKALTPAPAGYEPYLMNHYGRHGARWLIDPASYTRPLKILRQADSLGILTTEGKDVLRQVEAVYASSIQRLGELTTVGERQHHGIGKRMVEHFPDLFKTPGLPVDARSTVVIRCILSMEAECEELAAANPSIRWHNDVSESLQYYLNQPQTPYMKALRKKTRELRRELNRKVERGMDTSRFTNLLFTNPQLAKDSIGAGSLIHEIFDVVSNMQSHDLGLDLYPYFTADELYYLWRIRNIGWYLDYGAAPQGDSDQPFSQLNLLKDIIQVADTTSQKAAVLRFGHEVCVMPLACLLELGSCGAVVNDLEQLDAVWRNYDIFPMGCNIQLVFYRKKEGAEPVVAAPVVTGRRAMEKGAKEQPVEQESDKDDGILVKALLNEREVSLPVPTTRYPYYRWQDLRRYYQDKIQQYEQRVKAWEEGH